MAVFEDPLAESESDEDESGDESDGLQKSTSKSRQVGLTILETDVQEAITVNIWSEMPMEVYFFFQGRGKRKKKLFFIYTLIGRTRPACLQKTSPSQPRRQQQSNMARW